MFKVNNKDNSSSLSIANFQHANADSDKQTFLLVDISLAIFALKQF